MAFEITFLNKQDSQQNSSAYDNVVQQAIVCGREYMIANPERARDGFRVTICDHENDLLFEVVFRPKADKTALPLKLGPASWGLFDEYGCKHIARFVMFVPQKDKRHEIGLGAFAVVRIGNRANEEFLRLDGAVQAIDFVSDDPWPASLDRVNRSCSR